MVSTNLPALIYTILVIFPIIIYSRWCIMIHVLSIAAAILQPLYTSTFVSCHLKGFRRFVWAECYCLNLVMTEASEFRIFRKCQTC